jgi:hypothetical protein
MGTTNRRKMKIEQTYIFKNGEPAYFVSTINRMSSTYSPMMYAETLAWSIDSTLERRAIVDQDEAAPDSTLGHERVVNKLRLL